MTTEDPGLVVTAERLRSAMKAADLDQFAELLDPDVRWGAPDDPEYACQNRAEVLTWYERSRAAGMQAEVTETRTVGPHVVVGMLVRGRADRGGPTDEQERWQVFTVARGRVVEIVGFEDREAAMARAQRPG